MVAFDQDLARLTDFRFQHRVLSQAPHQHGCPAVYEAFRQSLMQRIRQPVLDLARFFLPVCRIGKPSWPVRHEGPGADLGNAGRKHVDIALGRFRAAYLLGHVVRIDMAAVGDILEDRADQIGMLGRRDAPVVGQRAGIPQKRHALGPVRQAGDFGVARQQVERGLVGGGQRACQTLQGRDCFQRPLQRFDTVKIEEGGAPLQHPHGIEVVRLDSLHQRIGEGVDLSGDAESAVADVSASAPRDLADLGGVQFAVLIAVELVVLGKGDMVDVEVEAHANGVGCHEVIDVA